MIYWIKKYFSNPKAHGLALYEVIVIAFFSIAPIAVTLFIRSAQAFDATNISMSDITGRGQVYLLAYGVFGTVFWLAFLNSSKPRNGARAFLGFVATFIIIPVVGFIGADPSFSTVLNEKIVTYSYWFYGSLLIIYYLILFYSQIEPPEPDNILDRGAEDMRRRYTEMQTNG
jgi:hypothetical protein